MSHDGIVWYGMGHGAARAGRPGFDRVLPALLVGEYPRPEDAEWLRAQLGVGAVVSLQDDADLASKRLRLATLEEAYRRAGIAFARFPVADGDADGLAARLPAIVHGIHLHLGEGRRVYLHCNAGMNRAPTAAVAYLHVHHRLSVAEALAFVTARRNAVPYRAALRRCYPGG